MKAQEKAVIVPNKSATDFVKDFGTKSNAIRLKRAEGLTRGQVKAWFMTEYGIPILYQHVRNVDVTVLKSKTVATEVTEAQ